MKIKFHVNGYIAEGELALIGDEKSDVEIECGLSWLCLSWGWPKRNTKFTYSKKFFEISAQDFGGMPYKVNSEIYSLANLFREYEIDYESDPDDLGSMGWITGFAPKNDQQKLLTKILADDFTLRKIPCLLKVLNFLLSLPAQNGAYNQNQFEQWFIDYSGQKEVAEQLNKLAILKSFTAKYPNPTTLKEINFKKIHEKIIDFENRLQTTLTEIRDLKVREMRLEEIMRQSELSKDPDFHITNVELLEKIVAHHELLQEVDLLHNELYKTAIEHQDQGVKGFLKFTYWRSTATSMELEKLIATPAHFKSQPHPPEAEIRQQQHG